MVRVFLVSESPVYSSAQMAEARQELEHWASYWGRGTVTSVALERVESGDVARVEESDGTLVDVRGKFILHFVGQTSLNGATV